MSESGLPKYFVLRNAENKYLQYVPRDGKLYGNLRFRGAQAISPYSKFEFVPAKHDKESVHIRCCYNNKLWMGKAGSSNETIFALANEPEEELSKSRTMFSTSSLKNVAGIHKEFSLFNLLANTYASIDPHGNSASAGLLSVRHPPMGQGHIPKYTTFDLIDWESFVILPERVVFKGDNDRYLTLRYKDADRPYLAFDSTDDVNLPTLINEVISTPDGNNIRIKSVSNGKFWNLARRWIWADESEKDFNNLSNPDSLFQVVNGPGGGEVALQNMGNNLFCQRLTKEGKTDCLHAEATTMVKEAILKVEEPVVRRLIRIVDFHLEEARFYDENVVSVLNKTFVNLMREFSHHTTLTDTYTTETTSTWNASIVSLKSSKKFEVSAGVKIIGKEKLEAVVLDEVQEGGFEYGVANKKTVTHTLTQDITIPPESTLKINVVATETKYDVPYSYEQVDTLTDGRQVTYVKDDGMYSGSNCYDFRTEDPVKQV